MSQDLVFIAGNFGESTYIYVANLLLPVKENKKKKSENLNTTIWSNNLNHLCDYLLSIRWIKILPKKLGSPQVLVLVLRMF